jgi:phosphohistidine phosphatase
MARRENVRVDPHTLVIMRHAKAANPDRTADVDRPLTARGHADATAAGPWLQRHGYEPGLVLCSPARRARETWQALGVPSASVLYDRRLYAATALELLDVVAEVKDEVRIVLLVGHNPALSDLSALLDPAHSGDGLRTSGIAVHAVDAPWAQWGPGSAPLADSHTARA